MAEVDSGGNLGLIPFLRQGTAGMVAGALPLVVVLSRLARKKVA